MTGPLVILGPDDLHRDADIPAQLDRIHATRVVFPDGEQLITLPGAQRIRGQHTLIVQTTAPPQHARLFLACQLNALARAARAASIACFAAYLCYQRQDKASRPGESLGARTALRLLGSSGADTVMTVDRHSDPAWDPDGLPRVVNLCCAEPVARTCAGDRPDFVVATDRGGAGRATRIARALGVPVVVLHKRKSPDRGTYYDALPDCLASRDLLLVDDVCTSGSTIAPLCASLVAMHARLTVAITHVVATSNGPVTSIAGVDRLLYSDSCGDPAAPIRVLPLALEHWLRELDAKPAPPAGGR